MNYAVIDIGSNTIRLCVYDVTLDEKGKPVEIDDLFQKKMATGLANYIEDGEMTPEGVRRAIFALRHFGKVLDKFGVDEVHAFATASLRNISNSSEVIVEIEEETGLSIDLISGPEEGELDYYGVRPHISSDKGILIDIGGGSTELTSFNACGPQFSKSYPVGSLNMFNRFVSGTVVPTEAQIEEMSKYVKEVIPKADIDNIAITKPVCVVGGSGRAIRNMINMIFSLPDDNRTITMEQLSFLLELLKAENASALKLLLKYTPDRVHTLVPGLTILYNVGKRLKCKEMEVSGHGIREGYLLKYVLHDLVTCSEED